MLELEKRKAFGPEDVVTTLTGPHANIGLKVKEIRDDGITVVIPKSGATAIEIPTVDLYHVDDYHEAFKASIIKEQYGGGFDTVN